VYGSAIAKPDMQSRVVATKTALISDLTMCDIPTWL
jgi:hypothetical protein